MLRIKKLLRCIEYSSEMTFVSLVQLPFTFIIFPPKWQNGYKYRAGTVSYIPFKAGVHHLPVSRTHWNPPLLVKAPLFLVTLWAEERYMWPRNNVHIICSLPSVRLECADLASVCGGSWSISRGFRGQTRKPLKADEREVCSRGSSTSHREIFCI